MAQAWEHGTGKSRRGWRRWFAREQGWTAETLRRVFLTLGLAVAPAYTAFGQDSSFRIPPAHGGGSAMPSSFPTNVQAWPMQQQQPGAGQGRTTEYPAVGREPESLPDLGIGQQRLLRLSQPLVSVQVSDPRVVDCRPLDSRRREVAVRALQAGTAQVNLTFANPASPERPELACYLVRVVGPGGGSDHIAQARYEEFAPPRPVARPAVRPSVPGPELGDETPVIDIQVPRGPGYGGQAPRPMMPVQSQPLPRQATDSGSFGYSQPSGGAAPPQPYEMQTSLTQPSAVQPPAQKGPPLRDVTEEPTTPLTMPRRLDQHPCLEGPPGPRSGGVATPNPETVQRYRQYIQGALAPEMSLEIIQGRTLMLNFSDPPVRVSVGDEKIVTYTPIGDVPRQLVLQGVAPGATTLLLWFRDPADANREIALSYLVSVLPEPGARSRLERIYKQLQDEINQAFPDAYVRLFLVGDKLAVCGQVKDAIEAVHILQVIRSQVPANPAERAAASRNTGANAPLNLANGFPYDPSRLGNTLEDYIVQGESNIINLLHIPGEQQVGLKITVAEVSRSAARSMGINFTVANRAGQTVLTQTTGSLIANNPATGTGTGSTNLANITGLLDNGRINLLIQALRRVDLARSLAEQNLVTLNGHPANFQAGGEFPVPVTTNTGLTSNVGVQFVPFGVQLSFTPYITDKDRIRLTLNATVSTRDVATGTTIAGANVPGLNARTITTTVEMREGQTLAIGGLMQTNFGADTTRIPLLGDIPFGGQFFRDDHTSASESELVLLVTPELIHPMEPNEIPPLPGSDTFEPSDLNFYLRGKLENTRSYDYRSPVMHDIERMRAYRNCEIIYMLGPTGYTDGH